MFKSTKGYKYEPDELKTWALYREFIEYNVFSQPLLSFKDEIYKAECDKRQSASMKKQLCGGSLESWKILNEDSWEALRNQPKTSEPRYQKLSLIVKPGLLKLMYKFKDLLL